MADPEIDPIGNEIAGRAGMRPFSLSLPMRLLLAREAVMRQFRPLLAEYDLSEQQWRVIRALKEQQVMEAGVLAQSVFLLGPSLTRILQNLESRGLVRRRRQAQDQRAACLRLGEPLGHAETPVPATASPERIGVSA